MKNSSDGTVFVRMIYSYLIITILGTCSGFQTTRSSHSSLRFSNNRVYPYTRVTSLYEQQIAAVRTDVTHDFIISDVVLSDMLDVIRLANDQFVTNTDTFIDIVKLDFAILNLFLPKLILPNLMKHSVIGVRSASDNSLVGFVDLSLQMTTGSLDALKPKTLAERQQLHGDKNLAPYLCNLFVSPQNRKKGLARKLIAACEAEARKWGCNCINLHVELSSTPALNLYLSCDFNIVSTAMDDVVFMTKKLSRNALLDPPLVKL